MKENKILNIKSPFNLLHTVPTSLLRSPLSLEAQLGPQQPDDLAHGLIDVAFLDAPHEALQQLHGEELAFLAEPRADQRVGTCVDGEMQVSLIRAAPSLKISN